MLNSTTTKLDQILNMGQSMNNKNGIGYSGVIDSVATTSNTVFVKAAPTTVKQPLVSKNAKPTLPDVKVK